MQEYFGQEVSLTIHDESGSKVKFDAAGLRVDFDVRLINGFSRGTFTIYNLKEATIKAIANGDNYATVKTKLHGKQEFTVAKSFYISNVLEEKNLPNSITTLFCFDKLRKQFLENPIDVTVVDPTLKKEMQQICSAAGFTGDIQFLSFPDGKVNQASVRRVSFHQGTLQQSIRRLQETHGFKLYTDIDLGLSCMYLPDLEELSSTGLNTRVADIILNVRNMRSNPKIGPATLFVTSNLDGRIRPTSVLDTSELLTAGTDTNEEVLQLADRFLKDVVSGFTKYQTLTVQHKGSNYTSEWKTIATATSPSIGKNMSTISWQQGT
jgi:hypothetical protein